MTLLLFFLALALLVSFFCSLAEAVVLSISPSFVASLDKSDTRGNRAIIEIRDNLDRALAAILTLNTIAHTVGAAGVGAQAAIVFGDKSLAMTSAVLTFLILVFSEIIPKTLGATYWKSIAQPMAVLIYWLTRLLLPFVWMSEQLTHVFSRKGGASTFSREEIRAIAEISAKEGVLELKELKIVKNLLRLHQLQVREIMTPRAVVFSLRAELSIKSFFEQHSKEPFSRIPIYRESRDQIVGYVLKSDLLTAQANDEFDRLLSEFERPFLVLTESLSASEAFDRLTRERSHMALVIDEYGGLQGLVTLEDVVETLIGLEITDELDTVEDLRQLARQRWRDRVKLLGIDPDKLDQSAS